MFSKAIVLWLQALLNAFNYYVLLQGSTGFPGFPGANGEKGARV